MTTDENDSVKSSAETDISIGKMESADITMNHHFIFASKRPNQTIHLALSPPHSNRALCGEQRHGRLPRMDSLAQNLHAMLEFPL